MKSSLQGKQALAFAGLFLLAAGRAAQAQSYSITDLGTLGGLLSIATGVNDAGQVVGYSLLSDNTTTHGFRTASGQPINFLTDDLGSLSGDTYGNAINASGQVAGSSFDGSNFQPFRTAPGGSVNLAASLGTLGGVDGYAYGINASGQTVGYSFNGTNNHAFLSSANGGSVTLTDLGTLGGDTSFANGINTSGQVTGYADDGLGNVHAFRTQPNSAITPADDLGSLGGDSFGYAINDSGQVVGYSFTGTGDQHAFLSSANGGSLTLTDLGALGGFSSSAYALNNQGAVVGTAQTASGASDAFLYENTQMFDLNSLISSAAHSQWELTTANGINNNGWIVGTGTINGQQHAFLLRPNTPEPGTWALLASASAAGVALRRRLRRAPAQAKL